MLHHDIKTLKRDTTTGRSSNIQRMRAAVHSGIAERLGLTHHKVDKTSFIERFSAKKKRVAWRFNSRRHKLQRRFSKILDKRVWRSPTPESGRISLAAWHWARTRFAMQRRRPPIGIAKLSSLMSRGVLLRADGGAPRLCLGNAKWGATALSLEPVPDAHDWILYRVAPKADEMWLHCVDAHKWSVVEYETCCPGDVYAHSPSNIQNIDEIFIREVGSRPLLESVFSGESTATKELSFDTLRLVAHYLKCPSGFAKSRVTCLTAIVKAVFRDLDQTDVDAIIQKVLRNDSRSVTTHNKHDDPLTEALIENLDADNKEQFELIENSIKRRKLGRKLQCHMAEQCAKKRRRLGQFTKRANANAKPKAKAKPAAPVASPSESGAAAAPPATAPPSSHPGASSGAQPGADGATFREKRETAEWSYGGMHFSFNQRVMHHGQTTSWQVICPNHAPSEAKGKSPNADRKDCKCQRTLQIKLGELPDPAACKDLCFRRLKQWCLSAGHICRNDHMNSQLCPYYPSPDKVPSNAELDQQLADFVPLSLLSHGSR